QCKKRYWKQQHFFIEHPHAENVDAAAHERRNSSARHTEVHLHELLNEQRERKRYHHDVGDRIDFAPEQHKEKNQRHKTDADNGAHVGCQERECTPLSEQEIEVDVGEIRAEHEQRAMREIQNSPDREDQDKSY